MAGENQIDSPDDDLDTDSGSTLSPAAGTAVAGGQPSAAAPVGEPAASAVPASGAQPPAVPTTPAAPQTPLSARDWAAQQLGYREAAQYADDAAMLQALIAGNRSAQQQSRRLQDLEAERLVWMQRAGQPQTPAPSPADPLAAFKGPTLDPRWEGMIEKDEQGNLRVKAGMDPTVLPKYLEAVNHRRQLLERMLDNPVDFLKPLIASQAKELAQQTAQEMFGQYQSTQYQQQFLANNSSWLFAKDSAGNAVTNPQTGGYVPTKEGLAFYNYLRDAERRKITDPQAQEEYARALLARDLALPHLQQQQQQGNGTAARQAVIDGLNRRQPSQSGSTVGGANGGAPQNAKLSFHEQLAAAFKENGVTDADFAGDER